MDGCASYRIEQGRVWGMVLVLTLPRPTKKEREQVERLVRELNEERMRED